MPGFSSFNAIKSNAYSWTTGRYEEFDVKSKDANEPADDRSPSSISEVERPPLRHIDKYIAPECPCLSKRFTVALLACMGFIVMFGMRCNMGLAKLELKKIENTTLSSVDSSIFWGYLVTQVPGGFLATKYPANRLFGGAIGISCLLNFFVPPTLIEAPHLLMCIRVLQGLVEGVTYPSCHGIWRYWAPPLERSKLATLAFCGCYAGVMFGLPIGGILVRHSGWKSPFYFYGFLGITWYLFWIWLVFEKPSKHPTIENRELHYIQSSLGENTSAPPTTFANIPWKCFFTSLPVWAIFVANFCRSWNFYLLVLFQASFVSDVYSIEIEENALLGALPHLLMTIIVPAGGVLADHLRKKGTLTTTQVRKLFNCGGFGMEATFFLVVAFSGTISVAITALTIGVAFSGFAISGFNVNHLDIAPKYASILMGLSNGIGTIAGCICPLVVHKLTDGVTNLKERSDHWSAVFILAACVHFFGVAFYGIFASGELQPWADSDAQEQSQWNPMDETVQMKKSSSLQTNGLLQTQMSANPTYGTVEPPNQQPKFPPPSYPAPPTPPSQAPPPVVNAANPFLTGSNPFRSESVQPQAEDTYLHGTIADRTY
ncbi:vesicular glutamate transporter 1 [Onthophagus taurus]|uniref:vesicular glutamate transporter 1 n=1 Tax=Onthophagus taurus TaxID=166361 RepID=UPI000C20B191|nr:vesicular glutamate transporter 1 [Onthophagus taurus]